MFLRKIFLLIAFTGFISGQSFAQGNDTSYVNKKPQKQKKENGFSWSKVTIGGNAGGGGSSNFTTIILAPTIGYRLTERFTPGIGFKYIYFNDKYYRYKTNIYGGNIFARFFATDFLFVHGEFEMLNGQFDPFNEDRLTINNVWLGGGLRQSFGANSYAMIGALWNINESVYSFPQSPQIIGGVVFGL